MKTSKKTTATAPNSTSPERRVLSDDQIDDYLARYQRDYETKEAAIERLGLMRSGNAA